MQMPGTSGVELVAEARCIRSDLHIVFASGKERIDGWPFLRKPFSREELSRLVQSAASD